MATELVHYRKSSAEHTAQSGVWLSPAGGLPPSASADPSRPGACFRRAASGVRRRRFPAAVSRCRVSTPGREFGLFDPAAAALPRLSKCRRYLVRHGCFLAPRVKRSLKLEDLIAENSFEPSNIQEKKSFASFSPTTGTWQMSPFASPTSSEKQEHRCRSSNGKRGKSNYLRSRLPERHKSASNDKFMMLLSEVEKSSESVMEMMQNLTSIKALKSRKELESLIGISCASCFLKREMQKTKELMTKAKEQNLFEQQRAGLPKKGLRPLDSYEFLRASLR
ncbi:centromere protein R [Tenrec ecaudatus]|uniref:centromere protein R n=1 Tax=Tenrec ecaudatus TaxID=94439 RepID=UPI003F5A49D9